MRRRLVWQLATSSEKKLVFILMTKVVQGILVKGIHEEGTLQIVGFPLCTENNDYTRI